MSRDVGTRHYRPTWTQSDRSAPAFHSFEGVIIKGPEPRRGLNLLCLITSLCPYLYGGLYGGLYESAHIINNKVIVKGPAPRRGPRSRSGRALSGDLTSSYYVEVCMEG